MNVEDFRRRICIKDFTCRNCDDEVVVVPAGTEWDKDFTTDWDGAYLQLAKGESPVDCLSLSRYQLHKHFRVKL